MSFSIQLSAVLNAGFGAEPADRHGTTNDGFGSESGRLLLIMST
jgi:hypothetical protein